MHRHLGTNPILIAAFVVAWAVLPEPSRGEMPGIVRERTLQSLSATPDRVFSNYLSFDPATLELTLSRQSGENQSGTYWAIRTVGPIRGYLTACSVASRSNSPYNGWLLTVDAATGQLKLVKPEEHPKAPVAWYLRYAGKHNGYDAYVLQTFTDQEGRDLQFLGLEPLSGKPRLTPKLNETTQWFLWNLPDLPTEP